MFLPLTSLFAQETFDDFFLSLLFGEGAWLGLILIITFFVMLMLAWKYASILIIPSSILIGLTYLENDLLWQPIICFTFAAFCLFHASKELK